MSTSGVRNVLRRHRRLDVRSGPSLLRTGDIWRLTVYTRLGWKLGRRPWLAIALSGASILVFGLLRRPRLGAALWHSGAVYSALPLKTELWRLPMSLLLPTPYLPFWGAAAQLLVVIGIGELLLGRWMTLVVAAAGHFAATLTTRLVIEFGQGTYFALRPELAHSLDTGPSAAVTAVGACLLVGLRLNRLTVILCASLLIAAGIAPGIDGQEHLVALAVGLIAGGVYRHSHPIEQLLTGSTAAEGDVRAAAVRAAEESRDLLGSTPGGRPDGDGSRHRQPSYIRRDDGDRSTARAVPRMGGCGQR